MHRPFPCRSYEPRASRPTPPQLGPSLASAPDIPTVDEAGLPGFYVSAWFAFFAPKCTPKPIINKLNAATVEALAAPEVRTRFADLGLELYPREEQTPEALAAVQKADIEKWWPIIKGIKAPHTPAQAPCDD